MRVTAIDAWRTHLRRRSDDGQFLAMTAVFMTMFLALAGLVTDGGHYLDVKQQAASVAEQAARTGAGSLDVGQLHAGTIAVDPTVAVTTAENYMSSAGPARHRLGGRQHRLRPDQRARAHPAPRHHRRGEPGPVGHRVGHRREWHHHRRMTVPTRSSPCLSDPLECCPPTDGSPDRRRYRRPRSSWSSGWWAFRSCSPSLVGWPLPHHVPSGSEAAHALGASIPDSFWPRLFAILAWLAWAYFAFSVVISLVDQVRGRRTGHRSHLVGSSAMAALITAVLVLGQLRGAHSATGVVRSGPPSTPPPVVQLLSQTTSGLLLDGRLVCCSRLRNRPPSSTPSCRATRCGASPSSTTETASSGRPSSGPTWACPSQEVERSPMPTGSIRGGR